MDYYKGGGYGLAYWSQVASMTVSQIVITYKMTFPQARKHLALAKKKIANT